APRQPSRPTLPDALPLSRAQPAPTTHQEPTATTTHQPQWTIIPDDGSRSKRDTLLEDERSSDCPCWFCADVTVQRGRLCRWWPCPRRSGSTCEFDVPAASAAASAQLCVQHLVE